jgi:glycosyltransferase involved in cell wall biosynthesis
LKVLIQNNVFYPNVIGGAEMSSWLLAVELEKRGWRVDAMATTGRHGRSKDIGERPLPETSGTVYEAPGTGLVDLYVDGAPPAAPNILVRAVHHFSQIRSLRWEQIAHEVFDRVQPDLLHTNTIVGSTGSIWRAAKERRIPVIHTLRDYFLLCPRTTLLRSDGSDCENAPLPCRILRSGKLPATECVDVVTAPSNFVLQRHLEAGAFANAHAEVVPNACEGIVESLPDRSGGGVLRGLYLGQLDHHKGVAMLLEAIDEVFAEDSQLEFDFGGVGPMEEELRAFCRRSGGRARYHGMVSGDAKAQLLRDAHFVTVPSTWNVNFPRTMLDAFSNGLPVIGTRRGGIPEVVRDGVDGIIIEPDSGELAAAIRLYLGEPELRLRHGASGYERAGEYTLDRQVSRFEAFYRQLADRGIGAGTR